MGRVNSSPGYANNKSSCFVRIQCHAPLLNPSQAPVKGCGVGGCCGCGGGGGGGSSKDDC